MRQNKGERRERRRGEGRVKSGRAGAKSRTAELCQYGGDEEESGEERSSYDHYSANHQHHHRHRRGGAEWERVEISAGS